jgi:hypothetical protein
MTLSEPVENVHSGGHVVTRVPVLSEAEAERVCSDMAALRSEWVQRDPTRPAYTLGTPTYMDAIRGRFDTYCRNVERMNPILHERFGWMYAKVMQAVDGAGFTPALHDPRLSYPGFHIYFGEGGERRAEASIHYDLQYEHIDWSPYGSVDLTHPLSFTLALRLPAGGGGLYVWDVDVHAVRQMPDDERRAFMAARRQATYVPYRVGEMVLHNGHYLHQIARLTDMDVTDARITLQGHAVSTPRGWVVYW